MFPGLGTDPRQMAAMMKRMGIDMRDIPGVTEVVIRTKTQEYVFSRASVSVVKGQGQETWQVQGTPKSRPLGQGGNAAASGMPGTASAPGAPGASASAAQGAPTSPNPVLDPSGVDEGEVEDGTDLDDDSTEATRAPIGQGAAPVKLAIHEEDIRTVMEASGANHAKAKAALEATGGDLAEAIVKLTS